MSFANSVLAFARDKNINRTVALGYFSYVLLGSLFLSLPLLEKVPQITYLDNLFIAASAVSTTGLTTISVGDYYNFWGQLLIIILIQLGGLGYMTLGSFVILAVTDRLSPTREVTQRQVFTLPSHINTRKFIKILIYYSLLVEAAGALLLFLFFRAAGMSDALWSAVFHSISAFCTAGFSTYNNSLEPFYRDAGINLTISVLCILGSVGFIVIYDIWNNRIKEKRPITLTSKIILWATCLLILSGTVILFFFEPSITSRAFAERLLTSFFQSMTALTTAGFNTISISTLSTLSYFLVTLLMIIGASPSGTGGGLKTTTFTALIGVMKSSIRGQRDVKFLHRTIPNARILMAVSSLCFYLSTLVLSTFLFLLLNTRFDFEQVFFEVASALGTVGLSTGITSQLHNLEKVIIIFTMLIGRIGPLSFGLALLSVGGQSATPKYAEEDLAT